MCCHFVVDLSPTGVSALWVIKIYRNFDLLLCIKNNNGPVVTALQSTIFSNQPISIYITRHFGVCGLSKIYNIVLYLYHGLKKGKGHPCTGTEALYRPYGR